MRYFDANCYLGRFNYWTGQQPITADGLLAEMDHYGIHEALVVASLARENHPLDGNEHVLKLAAGQPRLHPAWAALPPRSRELPPPADLVAEMAERGVRAFFLFPGQYRFPLDEWCVDGLLGPLADRHVPLFICPNALLSAWGASDQTDWHNVVRICRAFPELPVVISEARLLRSLWTLYQALEACPNLHVDLSGLWSYGVIEFICREWGAHRILFGSGLPTRAAGAVLGQLNYAAITEEERALIAGGNLRRLLSWNAARPLPLPAVDFPPPVDELHAMARARKPLDGQGFLCCHGHLGHHHYLHVPNASIPELVAEMDRVGLATATVFVNTGMNSDETVGNDLVASAVAMHPDRFVGLTFLNLHRTPAEMEREWERGWARGMRGIKLHPYLQGYDTNGPKVELACSFAHARRAIIVNHDWGSAERMLDLARRFPNACFITGHTSREAVSVIQQVGNFYMGSCPLLDFGLIEDLVGQIGSDRLLFGSDLSWHSIPWGYGPILYARISLAAKRLILGGNLRRLLEQYGGGHRLEE